MNTPDQQNHDKWDMLLDFALESDIDDEPANMVYADIFVREASRMQNRGSKAPECMTIDEVNRKISLMLKNPITGTTDHYLFTNHGWGICNASEND